MKLKLLLLYSNLQENTNDRNAKESRENIYVCREPIFPSPTLLREDYDHRRGASCRPPLRNASQFIGGETAFLATTAILSPSPHLQIRVILLLCEHLCPRKGVPGGNSMGYLWFKNRPWYWPQTSQKPEPILSNLFMWVWGLFLWKLPQDFLLARS